MTLSDSSNVYADPQRAEAYATLEFPNTYYLAFRDLPGFLATHARGRRAIDFGCSAGRSTRFPRRLGFAAVGVDDVPWTDEAHRAIYGQAGLTVPAGHKPLAREDEPYPWVAETRVAPWVIYVLGKTPGR